jgi:ATP-dependent helicase YprA (DUF1998 family)
MDNETIDLAFDPFSALEGVRAAYRSYVGTFQKFKNPIIDKWINTQLDKSTLIFKGPFIELKRNFEIGDSFDALVSEGVLHEATPLCFTREPTDKSTPLVKLYRHQSDAIRAIVSGNNTIITTGTGSGKSFCFAAPIISECLRLRAQGVPGIKAIIVYPMNALANSQYDEFSARLSGSGLTIALYTGDTKNSKEEALNNYFERTGRKVPYDSELISREELKATPPDILLTNYVMLEYILTRFEDKDLFPTKHRGSLRFLVLDEVHTYTGNQGADVAYLIRRLKQHTSSSDKIRCIATSATIQSGEAETAADSISAFTTSLFGEPFSPDAVITEHFIAPVHYDEALLPAEVLVTDHTLSAATTSVESTQQLVEALLGRSLSDEERSLTAMGSLLGKQRTIQFVEENLIGSTSDEQTLVDMYARQVRPDCSEAACKRELRAAFLAGMNAEIEVNEKPQKRLIPKIHAFYSQGREIKSCISPSAPHLNDAGEVICPECARDVGPRKTFPLLFCRACGQEYYSVEILGDGGLRPREIDTRDVEGKAAYIYVGPYDPQAATDMAPDYWKTNAGKLQKQYKDFVELESAEYCPDCNQLYDQVGSERCICSSKVSVWVVPHPFLFCISEGCGVSYDRTPREFSKLSSFSTVGRSTATDVIVSQTLNKLPKPQKIIVFSDNRQDTALQAAHMNNIQKRMHFRRGLYQALVAAKDPIDLTIIGDAIFDEFANAKVLPHYSGNPELEFSLIESTKDDDAYKEYLLFNTVLELGSSQRRNQPNLEDVGLLKVTYKNFDKFARADIWAEIPEFKELTNGAREDYLTGFLDIMRYRTAIAYDYLIKSHNFQTQIVNRLAEEALFHSDLRIKPEGFSDEANPASGRARVTRFTWKTGQLVAWTAKVLDCDKNRAQEIIPVVYETLQRFEGLKKQFIERVGTLYMIDPKLILLSVPDGSCHKFCKKCGLVHHFNEVDWCTATKCAKLDDKDFSDHYFRHEYSRALNELVPINAEEHSGQIDGDTRKDIEVTFKKPESSLNVIVCTPTMELGIDIGTLSAVYMRNVPPSPSNYAQRAGRAGRKSQASLISTFCGVGSKRGPHDQYFYRYPEKIIAGAISTPRFLLDNRPLIEAHMHSLIFETLSTKVSQKIKDVLAMEVDDCPLIEDREQELRSDITLRRNAISSAIQQTFKAEKDAFEWLDEDFIENTVTGFLGDFNRAFDPFREEYELLLKEFREINALAERELATREMRTRWPAIQNKMNDMREGKGDYSTYRYLASRGFTPNYGFPTHVTTLTFDHRGKRDIKEIDLQRDSTVALSEYAPGNSVYYRGGSYIVRNARPKKQHNQPITTSLVICPRCNEYYLGGEVTTTGGACRLCATSLEDVLPSQYAIEIPDQFAIRRYGITSDEEERIRLGYKTSEHYHQGRQIDKSELVLKERSLMLLAYEHSGTILKVNRGTNKIERDFQETGFTLCTACNRWLFGEESVKKHLDQKRNRYQCYGTTDDIMRGIVLYHESVHDVLTIECPPPLDLKPEYYRSFYQTLAQALILGLQIQMNIDVDEVHTFLVPHPTEALQFNIVFYESAEGGSGILKALQHQETVHAVAHTARKMLHEGDALEKQCARACYECLCNYYNQPLHELFDRTLVLPLLGQLEKADIKRVVTESDEAHYKALLALCESEFERKVLNEIRRQNLPLPSAAQRTIFEADEPVAQADFYYDNHSVILFVDGQHHDEEHNKSSDKLKRGRLEGLGYRLFVLRYDEDFSQRVAELAKWIA